MKLTLDEIQFLLEAMEVAKPVTEDGHLRGKLMQERHRLIGLKEACEAVDEIAETQRLPHSTHNLRRLTDHARKDGLW